MAKCGIDPRQIRVDGGSMLSPVSTSSINRLRVVASERKVPVPWLRLSECMTQRLTRYEVELRTGLETDILLDAIVELGTWLGLHYGAAPSEKLPKGFTRTTCGRDVRRAVTNCGAYQLTEADLGRFRPDTSVRVEVAATVELAQSLCMIERLRGLDGVEELARRPDGKLDPVFAQSIVLTYDSLTGSIIDAHQRYECLRNNIAAVEARQHLQAIEWVHPADIRRLVRLLDISGVDAMRARLSHPSGFRRHLPTRIADLRYGQIIQLFPASVGKTA